VKYIKNKIEKSFSPKLTDYFIQGVRKYNGQKKKDNRTKRQTTIYKALHRKLKIEQHGTH
jgi:hypothetical protein